MNKKSTLELLKKRLKERRKDSHTAWKYSFHDIVKSRIEGEIKGLQYAIRITKQNIKTGE